jgi:RNA polymerase sigma factor (sigma-70 family)
VTPNPDAPDAVLRTLLEKYGALIRSVVARVGGRTLHDARDDVAQAVALSLWQQVSREQTIAHPSSYIYRAAIRETVRAVTKELDRVRTHDSIDADAAPPVASGALDPEAAASAAEIGRDIRTAIAGLPADRQRAVRAHLSGYTVEQIMQAYGWPYQKARNLISRGMADLRAALIKEGYGG